MYETSRSKEASSSPLMSRHKDSMQQLIKKLEIGGHYMMDSLINHTRMKSNASYHWAKRNEKSVGTKEEVIPSAKLLGRNTNAHFRSNKSQ